MGQKFGLVLSGGGARGFFHMGVIKAIQKLGIEIEEIAGTSIGAIIGVIYAANPEVDFEKLVDEVNFLKLIQAIVLGTNKKFNKSLEKFIGEYVGVRNFEDLKIKTRFNASDVNNNQEIVFEEGRIFPGLIASISIPGVFPPLEYKGRFLVDGGVMNNIPITLIKTINNIIVSDVTGPIKKIDDKTSSMDALYSSFALMQENNSLEKARDLDKKIIHLVLKDKKTYILDFLKRDYQHLIDLGYEAMMSKKAEVLQR